MENYRGELLFDGKVLQYEFDEKVLVVHMYHGEGHDLFWDDGPAGVSYMTGPKELPCDRLEGTVLPSGEKIVFFVKKTGYGHRSSFDGECMDLSIIVERYYLKKDTRAEDGSTIEIYSKNFHKFLGLLPQYNVHSIWENKIGSINHNSSVINQKTEFDFDNLTFSIHPGVTISWGGSKFKYLPGLLAISSQTISEDQIWKLFDLFIDILQFYFMRTNISPDSFKITSAGTVYELNKVNYMIYENEECEKLDTSTDFGMIPWSIAYKHFRDSFAAFSTGTIYKDFLYEKINFRFATHRDILSADSAAFENAFSKLYPDAVVTPPSNQEIFDEIASELDDKIAISTGKKKDYYKSLRKQLKHETLEDKLKYAFNDCKQCFSQLREIVKTELSFTQIAEIFRKARNDIDHGNENVVIDNNTAVSNIYVRALIYSMLLKLQKYTDEDIDAALSYLFTVKL